ncbi:MBL fold metallo-hydrolase [Metabacillus litoralis]|uniref:MBL fold metallo-hydrolase n=1 Tax=Metabacillus litoralis TaxID=152268 RepID=UPI00203FDBF3|nr:MBL fold metallo-hydrolase [Metabacillus litoralis]MCM3161092.1 MBL fold metallo-hydrolase [Metabacillus litoralis]MCM3412933.1 MBL fold metallo-hydrolase [Metabacillus litoralis]
MPMTSVTSGMGIEVVPDVFCLSVQIVNVVFIGDPKKSNEFVLVDAGMPGSHELIISEAEKRFGEGCKPTSIVLTHGHFDHVGALKGLLNKWDVPVYAHPLEAPYLSGRSDYPPPNQEAEGLVAKMSPMFPRHSIDVSSNLELLNEEGFIPSLADWRFIHTPGHTPGHISLFRESDRALIVGDAFTTVEQESLYDVMTQKQEMHGPPAYFTTDWKAAEESVKKLQSVNPSIAISGHGLPIADDELKTNLKKLVDTFAETEVPENKK